MSLSVDCTHGRIGVLEGGIDDGAKDATVLGIGDLELPGPLLPGSAPEGSAGGCPPDSA